MMSIAKLLVPFALLFSLSVTALAQQVTEYAPFEPTPEWNEAVEMADLGHYDYALELFLAIADDNPGTTLGATALLAASFGLPERLERVILEYPDSRFEIFARTKLLYYQFQTLEELPQKLAALDELAQEFGGVSLTEILLGEERYQLTRQIRRLTREQQLGLSQVYTDQYRALNRNEDKLALARFGQEAFLPLGKESLFDRKPFVIGGFPDGRPDYLPGAPIIEDPTATIVSPLPGTTVSRQPEVILQITCGDYNYAQLELGSLEFKVDSEDVRDLVAVESVLAEPPLQAGQLYETVTLRFIPDQPLAVGSHTVTVVTAVSGHEEEGPGKTTTSWTFNVSGSSGPITLDAQRDSTVRASRPHRNEGANPLLMLSHRPDIRGRSNNPVVAFDLSGVDLTGLTTAKLVLNLRECDIPRRWGRNGRQILASKILYPWVEGNGKGLRLPPRRSTRGNGQGVTWFSPIDEKIENRRPNGSEQWDGTRMASSPPTAPPVTVMNRQTGPIEFDVTQDVLSGAENGWVIRKQDESRFGNIRFSSKEGGSPPQLILEYGGSASTDHGKVLVKNGPPAANLIKRVPDLESSIQYALNPDITMAAGQELLSFSFRGHPFAEVFTRLFFSGLQAGLV